jgi:hypothetical protein
MSNGNPKSSGSGAETLFKSRDLVPPLLPSDVVGAWTRGSSVMPWAIGATFNLFDPVFHPGETHEYLAWVKAAVQEIAESQGRLNEVNKSREGNLRDFRDCDDSAFNFKSVASAYKQTKLAAPLCVGVVGCRTSGGREHVINWIVSVDVVGDRTAKHPVVEYKLWFCDVQALVEASVARKSHESQSPALNGEVRMLSWLASPEEAARFFKQPFLVFA